VIEETAHVIQSEGEYAWVETERRSSCGSCSANKGCGTGALSKILGRRTQRLKVLNPVGAKPGDEVILGIREQALLLGSFAVYIVPLLAMLAGGLLGELLAPQWGVASEGPSLLLGLLGLVAGFLWLKRYNRRLARDQRFMASILRVNPGSGIHHITMNL
jgi:sigma-E factor negative regulatory protein RseC